MFKTIVNKLLRLLGLCNEYSYKSSTLLFQVLHQNFEFFRAKVEAGSKRILQYEEFAKRLINSNCYFLQDVDHGLEQIR